ncbi:hypothetical protein [Spiribacter sp. SSL99]|uniref:hypothetical protein n=1 Tax=Spiribacter sp. SSL99 TaxID=1866884 RepID=UPI0013303BEA|nr:hypothetical protein [Spiribacter sp. SSL99]
MISPKLCIHPGLPKTGTTSLQKNIFPYFPRAEIAYLGRGMPNERQVIRIRKFFQQTGGELRVQRMADRKKHVVVSDENMSMSPANPWSVHAVTLPESVAVNTARLAEKLGGLSPAFLITIRRQDTWLASRYAESAKIMHGVNQKDFERRLRKILSDTASAPGLSWLRYNSLCEVFASIRQAETLVVPLEGYQEDRSSYAEKICAFLDVETVVGSSADGHENKLSMGDSKWQTKGHQECIELREDLSKLILNRFRSENEQLSEKLDIDLSQWGYF